MPIVPLYGHTALRERLAGAAATGRLPASMLLHGPAGVGKQRLGLWLGALLLCESSPAPCGRCQSCRYVAELGHPDLHWIFPRPRLKDADAGAEEVRQDYAEAISERVATGGLYARPSGTEGIYVATVDLHRTSFHARTVVFSKALKAGSHRLVIKVATSGKPVAIDELIVGR